MEINRGLISVTNRDYSSKRAHWYEIIRDYEQSSKSKQQYCSFHNLNYDHFTYYCSTYRAKLKTESESEPESNKFMSAEILPVILSENWQLKGKRPTNDVFYYKKI